jgi:DNA (cytosine-5)-methyltransferase 1
VQGFPDDWTKPNGFDEKQSDRIDSLRYHAVGNAVTPPVAEWVGHRLRDVLQRQDQDALRESLRA